MTASCEGCVERDREIAVLDDENQALRDWQSDVKKAIRAALAQLDEVLS